MIGKSPSSPSPKAHEILQNINPRSPEKFLGTDVNPQGLLLEGEEIILREDKFSEFFFFFLIPS